jgi:hypothetical protein
VGELFGSPVFKYLEEIMAKATEPASVDPTQAAKSEAKANRPWFKKKRFIIPIAIVLLIILIPKGGNSKEAAPVTESAEVAVVEETAAVVETPVAKAPEVPAEYKSALSKAKSYSDMMNMSKAGIYDQLVSEFGEKFSPEAAQYAVDNLQADYNKNALAKAKSYQETMQMSPEAIRDQLTSEYGEKFTPEEADYAIQHLND